MLITVQRDATQSSLFIILQVHSTCLGCQPHPSSGLHKTVTTASGTVQLPPSNVAKLASPRWREVAAQKNMTSTGGCNLQVSGIESLLRDRWPFNCSLTFYSLLVT